MHDLDHADQLDELAICAEPPRLRGWVPAGPYRQHLLRLMSQSRLPWRAVAIHAEVPMRFVRRLAGPRYPRRVPAAVALRLVTVTEAEVIGLAATPGRRRVTARRVRWLLDQGLARDQVAEMLEISAADADRLGRDRGWCSARTELLARAAVQAHAARHPWLDAPAEAAA
ncbi:hypothetical protein [Enemella sp. A6]|uniref:hypothetical protein n=1 Tax=Enemella sp. A6 TaxID=3440152 RepID=UPI003EB835AE